MKLKIGMGSGNNFLLCVSSIERLVNLDMGCNFPSKKKNAHIWAIANI